MTSHWHKVVTYSRSEDWDHYIAMRIGGLVFHDFDLIARDLRKWAKAHSRGRSKVNVRVRGWSSVVDRLIVVAKFKEESDAVFFKLRWS